MNDEQMFDALVAIHDVVDRRGYPPTQREIAGFIGWSSSAAGAKMVRRLEAEGLIEVTPRTSRGIRITAAGMKALEDHL